jgi:hypothetical protein
VAWPDCDLICVNTFEALIGKIVTPISEGGRVEICCDIEFRAECVISQSRSSAIRS